MAAYYQTQIADPALILYVQDVEDLVFTEVVQAMHTYRKNPKNRTVPLPAHIRDIIEPQIDDDTLAKDAAARIIHAVSKFGWNNQLEAKHFIGELGWSIVQRQGGWLHICENMGIGFSASTFQAQARDLARVHLTLSKSGKLDHPPELPAPKNKELDSASENKKGNLLSLIKNLNEVIK